MNANEKKCSQKKRKIICYNVTGSKFLERSICMNLFVLSSIHDKISIFVRFLTWVFSLEPDPDPAYRLNTSELFQNPDLIKTPDLNSDLGLRGASG